MLRSINEIIGFTIQATDGEIGKIEDFYFDDLRWAIRYLVADTGKWLPGRKVLISPEAIGEYDWLNGRRLPIMLTKKQIEDSPEIDSDAPVSRQHEEALTEFFNWAHYWKNHIIAGTPENMISEAKEYSPISNGNPTLRSANEVIGYHLQATDDKVGHLEDFIAETDDWSIRCIIADTRNRLLGKKVLLAVDWISAINWENKLIKVDMSSEQIKSSPEYDPKNSVNREHETKLYDYYGRPTHVDLAKAFIVYEVKDGTTQVIAGFLAEKFRSAGIDVDIARVDDIKDETDLDGYDAFLFGSPTKIGDIMPGMKDFLDIAKKADLKSKVGGVFGTPECDEEVLKSVYDIMKNRFEMDMVGEPLLGESISGGITINASDDYAKEVVRKLVQKKEK